MISIISTVERWLLRNKVNPYSKRVPSDTSDIIIGKTLLNRNEGYEIQNFIVTFIKRNKLNPTDEIIEKIFREIYNYKKGKSVTREELWKHLVNKLSSGN